MHPTTRRLAAGLAAALSVLLLAAPQPAAARPAPARELSPGGERIHGGPAPGAAKAAVDSVLLIGPWGSGALHNGQFETPGGGADWNGWTSVDLTVPEETHWQASTDGALSGQWSAWCGDAGYPSCGPGDPAGGYGNNWNEILQWRGAVADPAASCTVDITATVAVDVEPGYDLAYVSVRKGGARTDLWTQDGTFGPETVALQTVYQPGDYEGAGADEVVVEFRVVSDSAWSDEDCSWPTDGAFRVDDVAIALSNGAGYAHDFEDGALGDLQVAGPQPVGDFAQLRSGLNTPLACAPGNLSPLVTFVDDGLVVPGTGGSPCDSPGFCYGPGGYTVNTTGGLAGDDAHLRNAVVSPVVAWPGPDHGGRLDFDVWRHNLIQGWGDPAGVFYFWSVRGTADPDPAAIADAPWEDRNFILYGHAAWLRHHEPIGDLLPPDTRWMQVRLEVWDIGYLILNQDGDDASPAPWFDNVRLTAYPQHGPELSAATSHLPHDAFPESGALDPADPGANSVRFDMGRDIASLEEGRNDPGDSVVVDVAILRGGAQLAGLPRLHWNLKRNPFFDSGRTAGLPDRGSVAGWPVIDQYGDTIPGRFAFDLPDSGFLFPGDVLHVFFAATDEAGGVTQTATLPADTAGFADFVDPLAWPQDFTVHALPTLTADAQAPGGVAQPPVLFWDDTGDPQARDEWYGAFAQLGLAVGTDVDVYTTTNPAWRTGQGLGGRATAAQLAGYTTVLYSSGERKESMSVGPDPFYGGDDSYDVQVLDGWLAGGGRNLLVTGDHAAMGLGVSETAGAFAADWLGVSPYVGNVLEYLGGQTAPRAQAVAGNPVFAATGGWLAAPACVEPQVNIQFNLNIDPLRSMEGVVAADGAVRLAEYLDPAGQPGAYVYSAATLHVRDDVGSRVISLPCGLRAVETDTDEAKVAVQMAARVRLLGDVLAYFGETGTGQVSATPDAGAFAAVCRPNPFNPATTISWTLPRADRLRIGIYDVRGRLVRRLVDRAVPAGPGEVRWDGRRADGRAAAAGVYFYRVRGAGHETVGKMALIK